MRQRQKKCRIWLILLGILLGSTFLGGCAEGSTNEGNRTEINSDLEKVTEESELK